MRDNSNSGLSAIIGNTAPSSKDAVTGLYARSAARNRIETLLNNEAEAHAFSVLLLDLFRFKEITNLYGADVSDWVLREITRRLDAIIHPYGDFYRYSNDEFLIVVEETDTDTLNELAYGVEYALSQPITLDDMSFLVHTSIGITCCGEPDLTTNEVIRRAGIASSNSRRDGSFSFYQNRTADQMASRQAIAVKLKRAFDIGDLELFYQPIVDANSGNIVSAEALVRWFDMENGWISPGEFIPIACERGMMKQIGAWVVQTAFRQVRRWDEQGYSPPPRLCINIATEQMEAPDFVNQILETAEKECVSPTRFELEITESSMMQHPDKSLRTIKALEKAGFQVAIDDFGTGYSSLAKLRHLPVDTLKIDKQFINNIVLDRQCRTIASTIVAMARSMNMVTVGEGVEEYEQYVALRELGCDFIQGFYFGMPKIARDFARDWMMVTKQAMA